MNVKIVFTGSDVTGKVYKTEAGALARVKTLRGYGFWPGIKRCEHGFELTFDPDVDWAYA